jgi:crotonobetainyl-CoA:carnitine CoA-transferase CaiB-like acyl-CoA transferase
MPGPLSGFRVVDCSEGYAGPMAAMYLADYGADGLKVEPPGGEPGRQSPGFPLWNRNKRGATFDLAREEERACLRAWIAGADVCVLSQPPAWLRERGLEPGALVAANPRLCCLYLPTFLGEGPEEDLPESAQLLAAAGGAGIYQSGSTPVPIDPVIPHVSSMQAIWGAACAVGALYEREASGLGQVVKVGGLHAVILALVSQAGHPVTRPPTRPPGPPQGGLPTYRIYQCGDGEWLMMAGLTPAFRVAGLSTIGVLEELLADPRLDGELNAIGLLENIGWVSEVIAAAFRTRPRAEWLELLPAAGCPAGPVLLRDEWLAHPQLEAVGMRVCLDDPNVGPVVMPGLAVALSASPGAIVSASPLPGQAAPDRPWTPLAITPDHLAAPGDRGPLAGVRVLDLGAIVAGAYGATLLGDLGADVIKVEPPSGDNLRNLGHTFTGYNLGKRGIVLDLRQDAGREVFYRLARDADLVVDNYRPGVLERLGLDYESLRKVNPAIISVSVTGYGETGPLGNDPGFDPLLQAQSGMMRAQGGDGPPVFFTIPVNDVGSGATAALAGTLALLHRRRTGAGQRATTSLLAQSLMMQASEVVQYAGRPPSPRGGVDFPGPAALDRYYATLDGWVRLRATAAGDPERLRAAGLVPSDVRPGDDDALRDALASALAPLKRHKAVGKLRDLGITAVAARTLGELPAMPAAVEQHVLEPVHWEGNDLWLAGAHARFSRTQRDGPRLPPGLGEHTVEVLSAAGFSHEAIEQLLSDGVAVAGAPYRFVI